jgi:hypothetical protein
MKNDTLITAKPNLDPLSGAPGAHPVGTGVGAVAGGAAAGAAVGSVAGPVGTGMGMAAGAIAGGLVGKAVAEKIDPTEEDSYWRQSYVTRSYVDESYPYETYQPAYRVGYVGYSRYPGKTYDEAEADLRRDYESDGGPLGLQWEHAKGAARDAWERLEKRFKDKKREKQYA